MTAKKLKGIAFENNAPVEGKFVADGQHRLNNDTKKTIIPVNADNSSLDLTASLNKTKNTSQNVEAPISKTFSDEESSLLNGWQVKDYVYDKEKGVIHLTLDVLSSNTPIFNYKGGIRLSHLLKKTRNIREIIKSSLSDSMHIFAYSFKSSQPVVSMSSGGDSASMGKDSVRFLNGENCDTTKSEESVSIGDSSYLDEIPVVLNVGYNEDYKFLESAIYLTKRENDHKIIFKFHQASGEYTEGLNQIIIHQRVVHKLSKPLSMKTRTQSTEFSAKNTSLPFVKINLSPARLKSCFDGSNRQVVRFGIKNDLDTFHFIGERFESDTLICAEGNDLVAENYIYTVQLLRPKQVFMSGQKVSACYLTDANGKEATEVTCSLSELRKVKITYSRNTLMKTGCEKGPLVYDVVPFQLSYRPKTGNEMAAKPAELVKVIDRDNPGTERLILGHFMPFALKR